MMAKISLMVLILSAMIMMAVIVMNLEMTELIVVVAMMVVVKLVHPANLILLPMDLNAAIQHGVSLVLIVLLWKPTIAGIVPVVDAQVTPVVMMDLHPVMKGM